VVAAQHGHAAVCFLLLRLGAAINHATAGRVVTPLGAAAGAGHIDVCKLLLEAGAEANTVRPGAAAPLALAAAV
jgi:hypothetical protein